MRQFKTKTLTMIQGVLERGQQKQPPAFKSKIGEPFIVNKQSENLPFFTTKGVYYDLDQQEQNLYDLLVNDPELLKEFTKNLTDTTASDGNIVFSLPPVEYIIQMKQFNRGTKTIITQTIAGLVQLWDFQKGKLIQTLNQNLPAKLATFSRNFDIMAMTSSFDQKIGIVFLWNLHNGSMFLQIDVTQVLISAITLNSNGTCLAVADHNKIIQLYKTQNGQQLLKIDAIENIISQLVFIEDKFLVIAHSKYMNIWNLDINKVEREIEAHNDDILFMEIDDFTYLYTAGKDQDIKRWTLEGYELVQTNSVKGTITCFTVSKEGSRYACGTDKGLTFMYDLVGLQNKIYNFQQGIYSLSFINGLEEIVIAREKNEIMLYNYTDRRVVQKVIGHKDNITTAAYSAVLKILITCDNTGNIIVWTLQNSDSFQFYKQIKFHNGKITHTSLHPSQKQIAIGCVDLQITIWNCLNWNIIKVINITQQLLSLSYSSYSQHLLFCCKNEVMQTYSSQTYEKLEENYIAETEVYQMIFHPTKQQVVLAIQKSLVIYDLETKKKHILLSLDKGIWVKLQFSQSGNYFAASSNDGVVRVWIYPRRYLKFMLRGQLNVKESFLFIQNEEYLVTGNSDAEINILSVQTEQEILRLDGHAGGVNSLMLISQNMIVSCGNEGRVNIWKIGQYLKPQRLEKHKEQICSVIFSPDQKFLYVASRNTQVKLYRTDSWTEIKKLIRPDQNITCLQLLQNGELLLIGGEQGKITVYNTITYKLVNTMQNSRECIRSIIAMDDVLQQFGYINGDNEIIVREFSKVSEIISIEGHTKGTEQICYYSNKNQLISSGSDNLIIFWDLDTKQPIKTLLSHKDTITSLTVHQTEDILLSAGYDGKIILWNIETEERIRTIDVPEVKFNFVKYSEDGLYIYANTLQSGLKVYSACTGDMVTEFPQQSGLSTAFCINKKNNRIAQGLLNGYVVITPLRKQLVPDPIFKLLQDYAESPLNSRSNSIILNFVNKALFEKISSIASCFLKQNILHLLVYSENFEEFNQFISYLLDYLKSCDDDSNGRRLVTYLFTQDIFDKTPFDVLIQKKNQVCVEAIIDLFTYYPPLEGAIYSIDVIKNFGGVVSQLITMGVRNLHNFFDSRIITLEGILPKMAQQGFDQINIALADDCVDLYKEKAAYLQINEELEPYLNNDGNQSNATNIKFTKVDIPNMLNFDNKVLEYVSELPSDNPIFGCDVLQSIIQYKWEKYARSKFLAAGFRYLIITLLFTFDSIYILNLTTIHKIYERSKAGDEIAQGIIQSAIDNANELYLEKPADEFLIVGLVLNSIFIAFFLFQAIIEIFDMVQQGIRKYFSQGWNILDVINISLTIYASIIELIIINNDLDDEQLDRVKLTTSINLLVIWCRLLSYLRGFDSTAFLITMILQVLKDMKYFTLIVFYGVVAFAFAAYTIQDDYEKDQVQMIQAAYEFIIGDFDNYNGITTKLPTYLWLLYILCSFITIILLLNLLISILGETYSQVSSNFELANNYEKVKIIVDYDKRLSKNKSVQQLMQKYLINITFPSSDLFQDDIDLFDKKITIKLKNFNAMINQNYQKILDSLRPLEEISSRNLDTQEQKSEEEEKMIRKVFHHSFMQSEQILDNLSSKIQEFSKITPTAGNNLFNLDFSYTLAAQ